MIGRKLSHFRILDRIGDGGMGDVCRAEDERLQRTVALKVLPPERLGDDERRVRFARHCGSASRSQKVPQPRTKRRSSTVTSSPTT